MHGVISLVSGIFAANHPIGISAGLVLCFSFFPIGRHVLNYACPTDDGNPPLDVVIAHGGALSEEFGLERSG